MEIRRRRPLRLGQWLQIVAAGILGMVAALAIASAQTPVYQSETKFFVSAVGDNDPASSAQGADFAQARVKSYPSVVDSQQVMQAVIDQQHLATTPTDLASKVSATVPLDTVVLDVTTSASTAAGAQQIAKGIANVLPGYLSGWSGELQEQPGERDDRVGADTADRAVSPNKALDLALGLIVGLAIRLCLGAVARVSRRQDSLSGRRRGRCGRAVLSEIPGWFGPSSGRARSAVGCRLGFAAVRGLPPAAGPACNSNRTVTGPVSWSSPARPPRRGVRRQWPISRPRWRWRASGSS